MSFELYVAVGVVCCRRESKNAIVSKVTYLVLQYLTCLP